MCLSTEQSDLYYSYSTQTQNTGLAPSWFKQYTKDATRESWFEYCRGPEVGIVQHRTAVAPAGSKGKADREVGISLTGVGLVSMTLK